MKEAAKHPYSRSHGHPDLNHGLQFLSLGGANGGGLLNVDRFKNFEQDLPKVKAATPTPTPTPTRTPTPTPHLTPYPNHYPNPDQVTSRAASTRARPTVPHPLSSRLRSPSPSTG